MSATPCPATRKPRMRMPHHGMTLIELLSAIAVVAVLAAILLGTTAKVRLSARKAAAAGNYRQIGTLLQMYVTENTGALPGSLRVGQSDNYSTSTSGREMLGYHLWRYMNMPEPSSDRIRVTVFENPLVTDARRGSTSPMFVVNNRVTLRDNLTTLINPWGYTNNPATPGKSIELESIAEPSTTWALQDIDALHRTAQGAGWQAATPQKPPLGDVRLSLYFDWHVGEEPVTSL